MVKIKLVILVKVFWNLIFENWKPVSKFSIEKVDDGHTTYNANPVQYTPEFKQKVKEVLS